MQGPHTFPYPARAHPQTHARAGGLRTCLHAAADGGTTGSHEDGVRAALVHEDGVRAALVRVALYGLELYWFAAWVLYTRLDATFARQHPAWPTLDQGVCFAPGIMSYTHIW